MIAVKGKTALVTGSSRGIGRGIVLKLAECGAARIAVHYLKNKVAAEETAGQLRQRGAEVLLLQADVSKVDDILGLFLTVRESFGGLDVFVSNARPEVEYFYEPVLNISLEKWQMPSIHRPALF